MTPHNMHRESGLHEIRIKGHLGGRWADWFGGMPLHSVNRVGDDNTLKVPR
jgi:hypothetical protein